MKLKSKAKYALGDAWIDVSELKIIKKAPETKKN